MLNSYSIKTDKYEGRKHLEGSMQPAYSEEEAKEKFDKDVKYYQERSIIPGTAITIVLQRNDPVHIVDQKTIRG